MMKRKRLPPTSNVENEPATFATGQYRKHEHGRSRFLPGVRDIIVYLPPQYEANPTRRFPALYMQDGQNLFDPATAFGGTAWQMGETADRLIIEGEIQPLVIVGIYNTGKLRMREYTPTRVRKLGGGRANRYGNMLLKEIKPFIDSEYRTLSGPAHTGIGGSSLGGLLALYLGLHYPRIFGRLAALSPSVWWDRRWIVNYASRARMKVRPRIWLDTGTEESMHAVEDARALREVLARKGWRHLHDFHYEEIEGGRHNEAAWALRIGPALRFLFPSSETAV